MMSKVHWQNLWGTLTTPQAVDADEARREYMTRVISLIMAIVALGLLLIFAVGWLLGFLPLDSAFITLGMTIAFGGTWWLTYRGQWRAAGYIPPAVIFLTAVYGNWIGGAGAPAMVLYALAIVLTAILQGERAQWITLVLSIAAYLAIGWALISGHLVQLRFPETAFANRVIVVVGGYVSLASLLWFLIHEFRRTLAQARVYADQLAVANRQLEQEISVRQQADESLRQSNEDLQALVDYSPLAIVKLDSAGRVLLWNHAAEGLYGWTRAEVLGEFIPMIPEKYLPEYQAILTQLLKGETLTNLEVERQRKDGALIPVNLSMAPLRDARGTITAFMSIVVDITDSHQAKAALHESEQRFRLFMQHFPGLAYIKDAATHVLFANQGFMDYLNIDPAAILGKTNEDIFPAEFGEQITADDQSVLDSGASKMIEERYGGRVWSTYKFVISQTDKPALLGGFTLDITERKRAEEESVTLAKFPSENPYPILRLDRDGVVLYANKASQGLLEDWGCAEGERAPEFWRDLVIEALATQAMRMVETHSGGRIYSVSIVPIVDANYVNLYGSNITERKQAEAQREELIRELEAKNAELERFTYTVSHDLKSPLVTIMGFLGYVQKDALAGDTDKLQVDMQRIAAAAGRMQHLLNDLLELSRIGRMMNPPEEVPFAAIVQEAVMLTQGHTDERGVRIDVAPELPVVYGDRVRLVEVVQNLIDNACKFMGDQPEPRITIGQQGTDRDGKPIVFVRDNGIGIEPQYHGKIFGLFDKLDPKSEGTGIGLALVKRIIEVHGGRIWIESAGNSQGATFLFTLLLKPLPDRVRA
jgi:PAS domain S-box-containing protein